jgi:D-alanine-D-alanine ligase
LEVILKQSVLKKRNIAIIFGGFSGERAISEKSALVVANHLDPNKYQSFLIDIDTDRWQAVVEGARYDINKDDFSIKIENQRISFDGVFNAIHGTPGEDGKIQGYFDVLGIPYNNCGVLASSITFDKSVCNRYLEASGVKVAQSFIVRLGDDFNGDEIINRVGLPCFVKPNDGGSSLGITKVKKKEDLSQAIRNAQLDGVPALIESFLDGVEVSCGCIKVNGNPEATAVTEIIPANEFFDYESKYLNNKTQEITPANISTAEYEEVMKLTEKVYHYINCKGMIRVDYMICQDGVYLIEVNTTPGLSEASILPQQAIHAGYSLQQFFDISVEAMFERPTILEQIIKI